METGQMIKMLREQKGYSQEELALKVGYKDRSSIAKAEAGKVDLSQSKIVAFAAALGVTPARLMGLEGEDSNLRPLPQKAGRPVKVPVLGRVPAGTPIEAIEDIIDWEEIPEGMTSGGREYFALQVSGDSMYPKYLDGDVIVVRRQSTCSSGSDCVVYVNGYDATLKTVKLPPSGGMSLQPMNPTYPPRTYTAQEVAELPVSIAGVVVELRRKVNV